MIACCHCFLKQLFSVWLACLFTCICIFYFLFIHYYYFVSFVFQVTLFVQFNFWMQLHPSDLTAWQENGMSDQCTECTSMAECKCTLCNGTLFFSRQEVSFVFLWVVWLVETSFSCPGVSLCAKRVIHVLMYSCMLIGGRRELLMSWRCAAQCWLVKQSWSCLDGLLNVLLSLLASCPFAGC